jgi:hypothetical protein
MKNRVLSISLVTILVLLIGLNINTFTKNDKDTSLVTLSNLYLISEAQTGEIEGLYIHNHFMKTLLCWRMVDAHLEEWKQCCNTPLVRFCDVWSQQRCSKCESSFQPNICNS